MHSTLKDGAQFMTFIGGAYGVIFLIMMFVYAIKKEWKMMLVAGGFCLGVEALVALVAASIAWPIFGLCWAVPTFFVLYVMYLRSSAKSARTRYGH